MTTLLTLLAAVLLVAFTFITFAVGYRRGRDAEWVDSFIARGRADRARRDKLGRFK